MSSQTASKVKNGAFAAAAVLGLYLIAAGYFLARPPGFWMTFVIFPGICLGAGFFGASLKSKPTHGVLAALAMILLVYVTAYLPSHLVFEDTIECTVSGVATKRYGSIDKYLIYTDHGAASEGAPGETFQNIDSGQYWKFNSSDIQGQASKLEGRRARFKVYGMRVPFFSIYRNVIRIDSIEE